MVCQVFMVALLCKVYLEVFVTFSLLLLCKVFLLLSALLCKVCLEVFVTFSFTLQSVLGRVCYFQLYFAKCTWKCLLLSASLCKVYLEVFVTFSFTLQSVLGSFSYFQLDQWDAGVCLLDPRCRLSSEVHRPSLAPDQTVLDWGALFGGNCCHCSGGIWCRYSKQTELQFRSVLFCPWLHTWALVRRAYCRTLWQTAEPLTWSPLKTSDFKFPNVLFFSRIYSSLETNFYTEEVILILPHDAKGTVNKQNCSSGLCCSVPCYMGDLWWELHTAEPSCILDMKSVQDKWFWNPYCTFFFP